MIEQPVASPFSRCGQNKHDLTDRSSYRFTPNGRRMCLACELETGKLAPRKRKRVRYLPA